MQLHARNAEAGRTRVSNRRREENHPSGEGAFSSGPRGDCSGKRGHASCSYCFGGVMLGQSGSPRSSSVASSRSRAAYPT